MAARTAGLVQGSSRPIIAVGNSGGAFARRMDIPATVLPVTTLAFARAREQRQLQVESLRSESTAILLDDIAVSGLTLAAARRAITPEPSAAAVGMLFKSKSSRGRIGLADVRCCVEYSRLGGGTPPVNSVESLLCCPERLQMLAGRYFGERAEAFRKLLQEATL